MDNWTKKILVSLAIFMALKHVVVSVMVGPKTTIYQHNVAIMMMIFKKKMGAKRGWCENSIDQVDICRNIFLDRKMHNCFKTVYRWIFTYLCYFLGPIFSKKYTKLRPCIPIEVKVSTTSYRLGSGDTLYTLADLYGISRPSASIIVKMTCEGIKKSLGLLVF